MDSRLRKPRFIFECYAELTRSKDGNEVQMTYFFPKDYAMEEDTKKQLPMFTFPMTERHEREEHFAFVLTDLNSKYRFGFVRYPSQDHSSCMVFLSDLPWYKVFYRALDKISDLQLNYQNEVVEPFLGGLHSHAIPAPGSQSVLSISPVGVDMEQIYSFPLPNPKRMPEIPTDLNLTHFYTNLHYNVVLHLFANMIFERRIIVTSSNLTLLSATVHGAVLLLYPLHWQHIFIPITPTHLIEYCAAPMPFLMGVHSSMMEQVRRMPTDEVVILDVDESTIESPYCDDLLALPMEVVSTLKHILKKPSSAYGDTFSRAFLLAMVAMIGGYRRALKMREGQEVTFDEDTFIRSRPSMSEFLTELMNFQHFRQFLNGKIDQLKSQSVERDLFDSEVLLYGEELTGAEQLKQALDKFAVGSKRLWDKTKEGSQTLGVKGYKVVDKGWKKFKKGLANKDKPLGDGLYPGQTIENTALLERLQLEGRMHRLQLDGRTQSLPATSSSPTLHFPSRGGTTSGGNLQQLSQERRPPPPVIPYRRHIEGKMKLAESLGVSFDRVSVSSAPGDAPVAVLFSFTPPDTPRVAPYGDYSESVSLDSKESGDVSTGSGDVSASDDVSAASDIATGALVDLGPGVADTPVSARFANLGASDEDDTESDSAISTSGSSSSRENVTMTRAPDHWERFGDDEEDSRRPPLPPPRSALKHLFPSDSRKSSPSPTPLTVEETTAASNPFPSNGSRVNSSSPSLLVDVAAAPSFTTAPSSNPFERVAPANPGASWPSPFGTPPSNTGRDSPLDDFSSSIAQVLYDNARRRSDSFSATQLTSASIDIINQMAETDRLPNPLLPTSSAGNATANTHTAIPRCASHSVGTLAYPLASNSLSVRDAHRFASHANSSSTPDLHATLIAESASMHLSKSSAGFLQTSASAGGSPIRPASPGECHYASVLVNPFVDPPANHASVRRRPPPPKPQPYTGGPVSNVMARSNSPRQSHKMAPLEEQSKAGTSSPVHDPFSARPQDPFSGLFGDSGMAAYASISGKIGSSSSTQGAPVT